MELTGLGYHRVWLGLPRGMAVGLLLLLMFYWLGLSSNVNLFAYDAFVHEVITGAAEGDHLQNYLVKLEK